MGFSQRRQERPFPLRKPPVFRFPVIAIGVGSTSKPAEDAALVCAMRMAVRMMRSTGAASSTERLCLGQKDSRSIAILAHCQPGEVLMDQRLPPLCRVPGRGRL
jgi:hypothetical protein